MRENSELIKTTITCAQRQNTRKT